MQNRRFRRPLTVAAVAALVVAVSTTAFALADNTSGSTNAPASTPPVQQVPARIAAQFPALAEPLTANEEQQLPTISRVMDRLASLDEPNTLDGANAGLARRISQDQDSAEWIVPGDEVVCMVAITAGHSTGAGCAAAKSVESTGTTSLTVVPGGYRVSGILPTGIANAKITNSSGEVTIVTANANHAFQFFSAESLKSISYALPEGGQHEGSLELPPPNMSASPTG